jgi:Zn-dependent peptidase ImmA (M78 family)/transcriptional regulator with XRE-family HTH domain
MIILARESRGLTQTELAESLATTQAYVSKYESGFLRVPEEVLGKLCETLDYPRSFFLQTDSVCGFGSSCFYHRKRQGIPMSDLRRLQAKVNILRIQLTKLLRGAAIDAKARFQPMEIGDYDGSAEFIAQSVRASWFLPLGPVQNLTAGIESAGGIVFKIPFGTRKLDAISQWLPGLPPMFFMNSEVPGDRLRWTLAHEVGHMVMHGVPTVDMEREADRFAAEFLLPQKEIRPQLNQLSLAKLASLKAYWKVSMQAILRVALELGRVTERQYRQFYMLIGKRGYRTNEPVAIPSEEPTLLKQIVEIHLREHGYSRKDLSALVACSEQEFQQTYLHDERNIIEKVEFS